MPAARKPTALKLLEGTQRPDRTNPNEPVGELLASTAGPPSWLSGRTARLGWRQVVPILASYRVATTADQLAIALLCDAFGRWVDARRRLARLKDTTYTTVTETGTVMHREHPLVGQVERAWKQALDAAKEFGMTAAARPKVEATKAVDAKPADADKRPLERWMEITG